MIKLFYDSDDNIYYALDLFLGVVMDGDCPEEAYISLIHAVSSYLEEACPEQLHDMRQSAYGAERELKEACPNIIELDYYDITAKRKGIEIKGNYNDVLSNQQRRLMRSNI